MAISIFSAVSLRENKKPKRNLWDKKKVVFSSWHVFLSFLFFHLGNPFDAQTDLAWGDKGDIKFNTLDITGFDLLKYV